MAATRCWVSEVVVGLNFCPFAQRAVRGEAVRYRVLPLEASNKFDDTAVTVLKQLQLEVELLLHTTQVETTLLVVPVGLADFDEYLDVLALGEALLEQEGYSGELQLASFHPDYCFDGTDPNDAANYTNRSPWPILQLLRESSVTAAVDAYGDTSAIPEQNIERARQLGAAKLQALLNGCRP